MAKGGVVMGIREKLEEFVSKLEYARSTGDNKYRARCPAHNDKSPPSISK